MQEISKYYDEILASLRVEFRDEAEDQLNILEVLIGNIESGVENAEDALIKIRRPAHSLKGSSSVAEFPLVTIIMHRLEDYLSSVTELKKSHLYDIGKYIDLARKYANPDFDQSSVSRAELVRMLPQKRSAAEADTIEGAAASPMREVMLVSRDRVTAHFFERELRAQNLNVVVVTNPMEALQMAIQTQPELFVTSAELDGTLSGIDIVKALSVMNGTQKIKTCLLTSYDRTHAHLAGLSDEVLLMHKNNVKEELPSLLTKI